MEHKNLTRKELINLLLAGLENGGKMDDEICLVVKEGRYNYNGYAKDCYNYGGNEVVINTNFEE